MKLRNLIVTGLFAVVSTACASSAERQVQQPQPAVQGPNTADATAACDSQSSSQTNSGLDLWNEGATRLDGKKTYVYKSSQRDQISLCDLIKRTGKNIVVFQFAGIDCIECREKSQYYSANLGKGQYRDFALVVVITDQFGDFPDSDASGYIQKYAPGTLMVRDDSRLWKSLSADPSTPTRATILAMNRNMDAVVVNREGSSKDKILNEALRKLSKKQ